MKIVYTLADKSILNLGAAIRYVPYFCAVDYLYDFNDDDATYRSWEAAPAFKKVKTKKDAALDFIKSIMARNSRGTKLFIGDRVNRGFHKHITPFLPEKFEAKNSRGTKIECTVEQGEPYVNLNSRAKVRETIIHIKNASTKYKRKD